MSKLRLKSPNLRLKRRVLVCDCHNLTGRLLALSTDRTKLCLKVRNLAIPVSQLSFCLLLQSSLNSLDLLIFDFHLFPQFSELVLTVLFVNQNRIGVLLRVLQMVAELLDFPSLRMKHLLELHRFLLLSL